jgi:hypothetical protein
MIQFLPQFRVLSPIPRFILDSAFYPQFRVLSSIPRFLFRFRIPFPHSGSAFYPYPLQQAVKSNPKLTRVNGFEFKNRVTHK